MVGAVPPMLGSFTQWVGDNVDHNVASIDGRGSFHDMGIIAVSNQAANRAANSVKRLERPAANANVQSLAFPILEYVPQSSSALSSVTVKELQKIQQPARLMQIVDWKSLSTQQLNPTNWGWQVQSGTLVPITTDQKPAPDDLLKVIRCSCKTTSQNTCGTNLCSCRRNGLFCVSACSNCHGTDCNNVEQVLDMNDTVPMKMLTTFCIWIMI